MKREKITLELMIDCIKDIDNIIKIDYPNDYKIFTIPLREYVKQQETQSKRLAKVEGLLELYQQKEKLSKNPYKNIDTKELKPFYEWSCEIAELENKIQSLEEEME